MRNTTALRDLARKLGNPIADACAPPANVVEFRRTAEDDRRWLRTSLDLKLRAAAESQSERREP